MAKEINRDKKLRMINRLKSFLFFCQKLNMKPRNLLKNSILYPTKSYSHKNSKWFFVAIQKGLTSEIKSMIKRNPELIYQIDKVILTFFIFIFCNVYNIIIREIYQVKS